MTNLAELALIKNKFEVAVNRKRSEKWCLQLWSRYIKARDCFKCVICQSTEKIQAHHIFRKTTYSKGKLTTGNGITLCTYCHQKFHEVFNGRPNLNEPIGVEGGDDQDEIAYLYGALLKEADSRQLPHNDFYYFPDEMLAFFVSVQGYEELYWLAKKGAISRLSMASQIWNDMPEVVYQRLLEEVYRPQSST
jgi:hypothetical protein